MPTVSLKNGLKIYIDEDYYEKLKDASFAIKPGLNTFYVSIFVYPNGEILKQKVKLKQCKGCGKPWDKIRNYCYSCLQKAYLTKKKLGTLQQRGWNRKNLPRSKRIFLHRYILNAPKNLDVDHINNNGLDNRRANLRLCTRSQNQYNTGPKKNNKSGYKGVSWQKDCNRYVAKIGVHGKPIYLGAFKTAEEAYFAYQVAAKDIAGNFIK